MHTFISMLRGINVGRQNQIRMADLKSLYESLGFTSVQTYVQSGNVVFSCQESDPAQITSKIEAAIQHKFGTAIPVLIRRPDDLQRLVDANPFIHGRSEDLSKLHITFLYDSPSDANIARLVGFKYPTDEYSIREREIYLFCPNGYGRTKLSNTFFEKKLSVQATTRNWNTVTTLLAMANEQEKTI